jgi:hypothetical protein
MNSYDCFCYWSNLNIVEILITFDFNLDIAFVIFSVLARDRIATRPHHLLRKILNLHWAIFVFLQQTQTSIYIYHRKSYFLSAGTIKHLYISSLSYLLSGCSVYTPCKLNILILLFLALKSFICLDGKY